MPEHVRAAVQCVKSRQLLGQMASLRLLSEASPVPISYKLTALTQLGAVVGAAAPGALIRCWTWQDAPQKFGIIHPISVKVLITLKKKKKLITCTFITVTLFLDFPQPPKSKSI